MLLNLIPVLIQLLQSGIAIAPQIIAAAQTEIDLFRSGSAPTQEQKDQIDAALEMANDALQAAQPAP